MNEKSIANILNDFLINTTSDLRLKNCDSSSIKTIQNMALFSKNHYHRTGVSGNVDASKVTTCWDIPADKLKSKSNIC